MQSADEDALRLASGAKSDTGWTANQSAGDKTAVIGDFVTPGLTGSDTVSIMSLQSAFQQVELLTKKLQAIEAALANNLRPNA